MLGDCSFRSGRLCLKMQVTSEFLLVRLLVVLLQQHSRRSSSQTKYVVWEECYCAWLQPVVLLLFFFFYHGSNLICCKFGTIVCSSMYICNSSLAARKSSFHLKFQLFLYKMMQCILLCTGWYTFSSTVINEYMCSCSAHAKNKSWGLMV